MKTQDKVYMFYLKNIELYKTICMQSWIINNRKSKKITYLQNEKQKHILLQISKLTKNCRR